MSSFLSLEDKINGAKEIIKRYYEANEGRVFVSFSGGKDSTVLLHIARTMYPDLLGVYSNTTNEDKDVIDFVKKTNNVQWVVPEMNFKEVVKHYGFPLVSKEVSKKVSTYRSSKNPLTKKNLKEGGGAGWPIPIKWFPLTEEKFDITSKCCDILKKKPLEKFAKDSNMVPLIGIMADESALRKQLALFGKESEKKAHPFLRTGWSETDIWEYAEKYNLIFAECYYDRYLDDGQFLSAEYRTGCIFCGFGIQFDKGARFENQKIKNPKRYEKMMSLENKGVTFRDALNKVFDLDNQPQKTRAKFLAESESMNDKDDVLIHTSVPNNLKQIDSSKFINFEKEFDGLDILNNLAKKLKE